MSFLKGFEKIVCKDDLRPILQQVLIDDGFAIATDGYKLVKVDLTLYGLSEDDKKNLDGYCLNLEQLNEIKLKRNQFIEFSKGIIKIFSDKNKKPLKKIELSTQKELDITFPRYENVLGKKELPTTSLSLNYNFLLDIQNLYKNIDNENNLISVFTGDNSYVRLQNFDGSFHAVVMPQKNNGYKDLSK